MVFLGKEEEQSEDRYLVVVYKIHEKSTINRCQLIETIVSREAAETLCKVTLEPGRE